MSEDAHIFIVSAPSGTGKTTLNRRLLKAHPSIAMSISYTARPQREGEIDGVDYHFISDGAFRDKIKSGDMLEYAEVFGILYGTALDEVRRIRDLGKSVLLEIDTQGWQQAKPKLQDYRSVFILPPSVEVLWQRLESRGTEGRHVQLRRLFTARDEIACGHLYDHFIINDAVESAYQELEAIVIKGKTCALGPQAGVAWCEKLLAEYEKSPLLQRLSAEFTDTIQGP